jgi:hypothetical protein
MRNDPGRYMHTSPAANAGSNAPQPSVGIQGRWNPPPENRDEATSREEAEIDVWEDEGGTPARYRLEFPGPHAGRHFDEFSG